MHRRIYKEGNRGNRRNRGAFQMAEINPSVKNKVIIFLRKLNENGITPQKAYISGSYSKGVENRLSDTDVAIISSDLTDDRFDERIRLMKIILVVVHLRPRTDGSKKASIYS
jgi:predicted nucleotidyltransferase